MKLSEVRINLYRNIVDSGPLPINADVTCLVGKNESGKTALLRAIYQLNPVYSSHLLPNTTDDYPRWRKAKDSRKKNLDSVTFVEGIFSPNELELQQISDELNLSFSLPFTTCIIVQRNYGFDRNIRILIPDKDIVKTLINEVDLSDEKKATAFKHYSLDELETHINDCISKLPSEDKKSKGSYKKLLQKLKEVKVVMLDKIGQDVRGKIEEMLPSFFYFSQYSMLSGRLDLTELLKRDQRRLGDEERTAISLLRLANVEGEELMSNEFESRMSELEAAANLITQEVFNYWTTNEDLIVRLESDSEVVHIPQGQKVVHKFVDIRLNDLRHQFTTNLDKRSSGFRWFFSFIAAFSEFERSDKNVVVLLDEPGLNLHARAQHDFLRFIDERLAPTNQVIYTTHSPFLVDPSNLERIRLVEDLSTRTNPDIGSKTSTDVLSVHGDTLFPLQAALGYDLAQNLFISPHNLIVEGPSDLIFLSILSEFLISTGREGLDERWTIVPVGGADKVPTFVALLGCHLDMTVLLDSSNQRIIDIANQNLLDPKRIIIIPQITGTKKADIEDLFTTGEYLHLYNKAFGTTLTEDDITGSDPILRRIERHQKSKFNHLTPAGKFIEDKEQFLKNISENTLERFERLFREINSTLHLA